jgi:phosphatidylinositol-3-phosphatase
VLRKKIIWTIAATLAAGVLAGCGGNGGGSGQPSSTNAGVAIPRPAPATRPCGTVGSTTYDHVVWIVMENQTYGSVIGSGSAPYETALAHQCATAAHWNDAGSKYDSLPNYIALTTGIPTGDPRLHPFVCDCAPSSSVNVTVNNLFRQVRTAGLTEKSYAEGMSSNCSNSGTSYAPKHNPALYMWGDSDRQACAADDVPMGSNSSGAFIDDLQAGRLPNFSFIAPNECHDTHDCGVAAGDAYLKTLMDNILASRLYGQGHTAVVVVWDEDTPVPNLVVSPSVHPGTVVESKVSHYSLLRATEDIFGLPRLLSAADAPDLRAATGL